MQEAHVAFASVEELVPQTLCACFLSFWPNTGVWVGECWSLLRGYCATSCPDRYLWVTTWEWFSFLFTLLLAASGAHEWDLLRTLSGLLWAASVALDKLEPWYAVLALSVAAHGAPVKCCLLCSIAMPPSDWAGSACPNCVSLDFQVINHVAVGWGCSCCAVPFAAIPTVCRYLYKISFRKLGSRKTLLSWPIFSAACTLLREASGHREEEMLLSGTTLFVEILVMQVQEKPWWRLLLATV